MPTTFSPGINGFTDSPFFMFSAIIFPPASPKPIARSAAVLIMSLSNIAVSELEFYKSSEILSLSFDFIILEIIKMIVTIPLKPPNLHQFFLLLKGYQI
jgi:hypothetical protein